MGDEFRAGVRHGVVPTGRFEVPVGVEDVFDGAGESKDVRRVRGIATIDEETSTIAGERDDVVAGSADQGDFAGEFGGGGGCVGEGGSGESERGGAGGEGLEKFTS